MKRLWIIFLASLIYAAFSKIQCQNCFEYNLFPFADLKMTWPIYAWNICINIVPIAYIWSLVSQELEKPKELKIAAWIITFHLADFILFCNKSYFHIGVYSISYDTLMFLLIGLLIIKAHINE